ncbi:C1 family peptidase [Thermococcus sp.]
MNKKMISIFVALVVAISVTPAALSVTFPDTSNLPQKQSFAISADKIGSLTDIPAPLHRTGLIWVPYEKYSKITGNHYSRFTSKVYANALRNAPFYPGRNLVSLSDIPSEVINTLYLPPVGDQGYVGSCNAWSSTYYVWTYMLNWWRNHPHPDTPDVIMNPTFTYNLINGGGDWGSNMWDAMNLISTIGAVPLDAFPLYVNGPYGDPADYAWVWPNLTQWMIAPHNSGTEDMYWWQYYDGYPALYQMPGQWYILYMDNETQWNYLKGLLANGYILQTAIMVLPSFAFIGHPEKFLGYLQFYAGYAQQYANEYWANQSYTNGTYTNWTMGYLLNWVYNQYNQTYGDPYETAMASIQLMKKILAEYNITMNDTVTTAIQKFSLGIQNRYINNATWMQNATFYLASYSINGEKWFINHGFDDLYALANFEWMLHYIPLGNYVSSGRIRYIDFYNYYYAWIGGHAVTIIGYNDNTTTPDGKGVLKMVNSWGTGWGNNGYWDYSYTAARTPGYSVTYVDGMLPLRFFISFGESFVYVPKAANYKPKIMSIVGIKHPLRGEVIDGEYNISTSKTITPAGIPIEVAIGNKTIWRHNFLDFWMDYVPYFQNTSMMLQFLPQAHPFPESPMAFDISDVLDYINYYVANSAQIPTSIDFYVNVSDKIPDNITGTLYNFTLIVSTPRGPYYLTANVSNATIPDGGWVVKDINVPLTQYGLATPANGSEVNYGNFSIDIITLAVPRSVQILIGNSTYNLSEENGGYYFYATAIAQKLKLPAGTYNYTVMLNFGTNKTLTLPTRTITIKGPSVQIISPEAKVYNTTSIPIKIKITGDGLNITDITVKLNNRGYNLTYNATSGLYETMLNLTNGVYTLKVKAVDEYGNSGTAILQFVVSKMAKVEEIANTTIGIIGGEVSNITVQNNTVEAEVQTSNGNVSIEVPLVNNVPTIIINNTAIDKVSSGNANASLVAGWNATVHNIETQTKVIEKKGAKKLVSVTLKANVTIGENGVAVLALRDINITKIKVIKDGQIIFLTTNRSAQIGYYYRENGMIFVVLKEDPVVEADGQKEVPIIANPAEAVLMLNLVYYMYYEHAIQVFGILYKQAENLSVDKLTLSEAMHMKNLADEKINAALKLTGGSIILNLNNPIILGDLRAAYVDMKKALKLLEDAIKGKSGPNVYGP